MKKLLYMMMAFMISGCVSPLQQAEIQKGQVIEEPLYIPLVNENVAVSLGETMMFQGIGWNVDCIKPNITKSITKSGGWTLEIMANQKICGDSEGTNKFNPKYSVWGKGANTYDYSVVEVVKKDGTSDLCLLGYKTHCINYKQSEIIRSTDFRYAMNSLQQSIEYMGRDGDVVKFLYTEFKDNMARSAFNREFIIDFSKGNTLNFKGAEVEIIKATNTSINYKVIKYFN